MSSYFYRISEEEEKKKDRLTRHLLNSRVLKTLIWNIWAHNWAMVSFELKFHYL